MPNDTTGSLYQRTRNLLIEDKRSTFRIAKESGISFYWLRKFRGGTVVEPSVNSVQSLYEFLTGDKLQLK